jgi:hypothetical protein
LADDDELPLEEDEEEDEYERKSLFSLCCGVGFGCVVLVVVAKLLFGEEQLDHFVLSSVAPILDLFKDGLNNNSSNSGTTSRPFFQGLWTFTENWMELLIAWCQRVVHATDGVSSSVLPVISTFSASFVQRLSDVLTGNVSLSEMLSRRFHVFDGTTQESGSDMTDQQNSLSAWKECFSNNYQWVENAVLFWCDSAVLFVLDSFEHAWNNMVGITFVVRDTFVQLLSLCISGLDVLVELVHIWWMLVVDFVLWVGSCFAPVDTVVY